MLISLIKMLRSIAVKAVWCVSSWKSFFLCKPINSRIALVFGGENLAVHEIHTKYPLGAIYFRVVFFEHFMPTFKRTVYNLPYIIHGSLSLCWAFCEDSFFDMFTFQMPSKCLNVLVINKGFMHKWMTQNLLFVLLMGKQVTNQLFQFSQARGFSGLESFY